MRYLFHYLENVERQIKDAGKMFILADYDGTLTPIVDKPDLAVLPEAMRRILQSIVEHSRYKLAIISGRDVETVKKLVNVCGAFYVGNHGFEIVGPNLHLVHPEAEKIRPVMTAVREELRMEIGHVEGLIIEDKRLTLSVHFRLAPKKYVASIKRKVKMVARKHREVTVASGKKVLEIRPKIKWDKGRASLWILNTVGKDMLPVYLGDDETDEDAFTLLKKGITILVSERRRLSNAKYFLRSPLEVQKFLTAILKI